MAKLCFSSHWRITTPLPEYRSDCVCVRACVCVCVCVFLTCVVGEGSFGRVPPDCSWRLGLVEFLQQDHLCLISKDTGAVSTNTHDPLCPFMLLLFTAESLSTY